MAARVFVKKEGRWLSVGRTNSTVEEVKAGRNFKSWREKNFDQEVMVARIPSMKILENYSDSGKAKCPDGCWTEPDGDCPHGFFSWLIYEGVM